MQCQLSGNMTNEIRLRTQGSTAGGEPGVPRGFDQLTSWVHVPATGSMGRLTFSNPAGGAVMMALL